MTSKVFVSCFLPYENGLADEKQQTASILASSTLIIVPIPDSVIAIPVVA